MLSNCDVGVARGTAFQEIRPRAGYKTSVFVKEMFLGRGFTDEHFASAAKRAV